MDNTMLEKLNEGVQPQRDSTFWNSANKLSLFITLLDLSIQDNNRLVSLIYNQVKSAELCAFRKGLQQGMEMKQKELQAQNKKGRR